MKSRKGRPGWGVLAKFFYFGLGVKRWILAGSAGIAISSIGLAFLIKNLFAINFPDFLPWYSEGVLVMVVGLAVMLLSAFGLYRSLGPILFSSASIDSLTESIYTRRSRGKGPRVVAIGGGTGLSVLLRGLKTYTDNITAIVTVADDGGSSGRLRRDLGVLPPGDFRNCLVAMSDDESLVGKLFQYRFERGEGLEGHSFGNLFIVAMTGVTGSFDKALYESSQVLKVHGKILPSTVHNLSLSATFKDGSIIRGESAISERGVPIERIDLDPQDTPAFPQAVEAIREAQLVVIGPGSLYTSILPNLLVSGITEALELSAATKVYVCNIATQKGETDKYTVETHVETLQSHTSRTIADYVVTNSKIVELGSPYMGLPVVSDGTPLEHAVLVKDNLVDRDYPVRHDPGNLARVIMDVYHGKRRILASAEGGDTG